MTINSQKHGYQATLDKQLTNITITILFQYLEAIQTIQKLPKGVVLKELEWSDLLEKAAIDHQRDLTATGELSGVGSDGSTYKVRIERYCRWGGSIF